MRMSHFTKIAGLASGCRFGCGPARPFCSAEPDQRSLRRVRPEGRLVRRLEERGRADAERKRGVPVPVLMATLRKESGFQRTPSRRAPGCSASSRGSAFRPPTAIRRRSTRTWAQYQRETGNDSAPTAPTLPTPWISSAGTMPRPPRLTASRQTTRTISTSPTISAGPAMSAATGKRSRAAGLRPRDRGDGPEIRGAARECD